MQLADIFNFQPEIRTPIPHTSLVSDRHVGIEVEVEGAGSITSTRLWNVIGDSSLRNEGREIVLRQPLAGKDLRDSFLQLSGIFHQSPNLTVSERCSVHVHIDVRDFDSDQLAALLLAYVGAEAALYKQGGKDRYDNIYCPGVTSALEQVSVMRKLVCNDVEEAVHSWCKYTGINLRSIAERGSVEFRAHEGTLDARRILRWTNILLKLASYAEHVRGVDAVVRHVEQGPEQFVRRVFGQYADVLLEDGVYEQYYHSNLTNVIDIVTDHSYRPKRAEGESEVSGDLDSILAELEAAVQRQRGQATAGGTI